LPKFFVSVGDNYTFAIGSIGSLWSWGTNTSGQLGDDTTITKFAPLQIGSSSWTKVTAGFSSTAEDPYNNFRPCPGKITNLHIPGGHGVRVDSHVYAGYTIPPNYDSMIAKLLFLFYNGQLHNHIIEFL
jgi:hypothetical protein